MFPLLIHSFDMVVSSIGVLSIRVKKSGNVAPFRLAKTPPYPQPLLTCGCSPCDIWLQVVLAGKRPSYHDLEGAAEEKLLE
eukprot:scaffold55795_cov21-Phaeocystis_antarctica.AAC.1